MKYIPMIGTKTCLYFSFLWKEALVECCGVYQNYLLETLFSYIIIWLNVYTLKGMHTKVYFLTLFLYLLVKLFTFRIYLYVDWVGSHPNYNIHIPFKARRVILKIICYFWECYNIEPSRNSLEYIEVTPNIIYSFQGSSRYDTTMFYILSMRIGFGRCLGILLVPYSKLWQS